MSIDYLLCYCNHRKFRHYHGVGKCEGNNDTCYCQEFKTNLSISNKDAEKIDPVEDAKLHDPSKLDSGLKDSGERIEFASGMVRDISSNKPAFNYILPKDIPFTDQMLTRVAEHLRKGAIKYSPRNWERADSHEEAERARESALRHMIQWLTGEDDEDHAAATIINVIFAETMSFKANRKEP